RLPSLLQNPSEVFGKVVKDCWRYEPPEVCERIYSLLKVLQCHELGYNPCVVGAGYSSGSTPVR
ncbi:MAG: hypothetical protein QXI19_11600, partial [Candidatus Caldarchaeum sp.]